ncbi:MAG TPA: acetyl-CoA carboxylase, carboxyltransferase subunit beta [Candidatus Binataceae bacterium]
MAEREQREPTDRPGDRPAPGPEADIWSKCTSCKEISFRKEVERNLNVCPKCGHHQRITVYQRIGITLDRGTWQEMFAELAIGDPLNFVDLRSYPKRIEKARADSGRNDAVVVGVGKIEERPVALGVMDFEFMAGSMGIVVGEKLARMFDLAVARRLPAIVFVASGGARMQEGALSLMQMAKVSAAIARLRDARLPYISVITDPTTGGVAASFAMLGDLNLAEPGALFRFAGRRVVEQTINQQVAEDPQRSEFLLAHGMLDAIVARHQMRFTLGRLLAMLAPVPVPPRRRVEAGRPAPSRRRKKQ